ncbi:MAG: hypothetical protein IPJ87_07055 [Flavobacteriales bacterium]|jgi:hypothetical protein|nr:hypothetical protein [Flavobacteriales bacterium]MBK7941618.1 hypothetical protein [Flavobacteriales bacterium]MBK8949358.1 hypothetical protein [Flavobacteriales bacterium]MBK9700161.1 hypothetical protein [Flavobacteriales bacterium]
MHRLNHLLPALAASFIPFTAAQADPPPAPLASTTVELIGWLHVEALSFDQATVEVQVGGSVHTATVSRTGRFDVLLPADTEVLVRFEHPGHLSKEVVVDTHHAERSHDGKGPRQLRMGVVLELEKRMGGLAYAGPVGRLAFDAEGGCVAVEHTRRMTPARRSKAVVF